MDVVVATATHGGSAHIKTAALRSPLVFEAQTVTLTAADAGAATLDSGAFALSFVGHTTEAIAVGALADDVAQSIKGALEAIDTVGTVTVSAALLGPQAFSWVVSFTPQARAQATNTNSNTNSNTNASTSSRPLLKRL